MSFLPIHAVFPDLREKLTSTSKVQFEVLKRKQAAFLFRKDCKSFGGQIKWVIIYTAVLE